MDVIKYNDYSSDDDALLMRKADDWTEEKIYFLMSYMNRFIVSMRKRKWRAINYIDLYTGPGKSKLSCEKVIKGSPLVALTRRYQFDNYYFSDNDPDNIEVLQKRCEGYENIKYRVGDANTIVNSIVHQINEKDKVNMNMGPCLNLAFLDPEGLELHWETVSKLANLKTDLIIYYSQMGITRNAENQFSLEPPTSIDLFFGDTYWREIYKKFKSGEEKYLHRSLMDYYKSKFVDLGYEVKHCTEPLFTNSKNAPLYRLLFLSKSELGLRFWNDVTSKSKSGQMRLC